MIFVVLGMHKSGTTLISRILHNSGIDMGMFDDDVSYDKGNKYERESVLQINYEILDAQDVNSIFIDVPKNLALTAAQEEAVKEVVAGCDEAYADWGFKDPRACFTYPVWDPFLPEPRLIAIYRHPFEAWPRYRLRKPINQGRNLFRAWRYLDTWMAYNLNIIEYLTTLNHPYLLMGYHELMTEDAEFERLVRFTGRSLEDMRLPHLYRNKDRGNRLLSFVSGILKLKHGITPLDLFARLEQLRLQNIAHPVESPTATEMGLS